jgi:crossover junction endodeoxyribonuclease RusA
VIEPTLYTGTRMPGTSPRREVPGSTSPAGSTHASHAADSVLPVGLRTWTIELPAGMKLLSQNGRLHYHEKNRRFQLLKDATIVLARQAKIPPLGRVLIVVEYQPPDRRDRDNDNVPPASGKACTDGLVAAAVLETDCSRHVLDTKNRIGPVYPKGRLVLYVTEAPAETAAGAA